MNPPVLAPPVIVVPDRAAADQAWAELTATGWRRVEAHQSPGWRLGDRCLALELDVADDDDARAVVEWAARGPALVVVCPVCPEPSVPLLADLRKLAAVIDRRHTPSSLAGLGVVELRLLDGIGRGATMAAAAAEVGLSERTAHRRARQVAESLGAPRIRDAALIVCRHLDPLRPVTRPGSSGP